MCRIRAGRRIVPPAVTLMRPAPEGPGPWREVFGTRVRLGQTDGGFTQKERVGVGRPPAVAVVGYSRKFFISHSAMPRSEM